jgi:hypothetical protein
MLLFLALMMCDMNRNSNLLILLKEEDFDSHLTFDMLTISLNLFSCHHNHFCSSSSANCSDICYNYERVTTKTFQNENEERKFCLSFERTKILSLFFYAHRNKILCDFKERILFARSFVRITKFSMNKFITQENLLRRYKQLLYNNHTNG